MRTFLVIFLLYVIGALGMTRHQILSIQNDIDAQLDYYNSLSKKQRAETRWRLDWDSHDHWQVWTRSIFWYGFVAYYIVKFLMFPRGIKSKFARRLEEAEAVKQAALKDKEQQARIKELEDIVLKFGTSPLDDPPVLGRVWS